MANRVSLSAVGGLLVLLASAARASITVTNVVPSNMDEVGVHVVSDSVVAGGLIIFMVKMSHAPAMSNGTLYIYQQTLLETAAVTGRTYPYPLLGAVQVAGQRTGDAVSYAIPLTRELAMKASFTVAVATPGRPAIDFLTVRLLDFLPVHERRSLLLPWVPLACGIAVLVSSVVVFLRSRKRRAVPAGGA